MHKKIRLQKMLIFGLAIIISVLIISLLAGRYKTVPVLIINSDKIDLQTSLDQQVPKIKEVKMSSEEIEKFGSTLVTDWNALKGARLKFPLRKGSPIPVDALTTAKSAGQFAMETPKYHTIFQLPDVVGTLPPGIQAGDLIDINIIVSDEMKTKGANGQEEKKAVSLIGPLLTNVKVYSIEENILYLTVSQRNYQKLSVAKGMGEFIVQLPGQKEVKSCTTTTRALEKEQATEINRVMKNKKLSKKEKTAEKAKLEEVYKYKIENSECYKKSDKLGTFTSNDILTEIKNNKAKLEAEAKADTEKEKTATKKEPTTETVTKEIKTNEQTDNTTVEK